MGQILHINKVFVKCTYYSPVVKLGLSCSNLVIIRCKLVDKTGGSATNQLVKLVVFLVNHTVENGNLPLLS